MNVTAGRVTGDEQRYFSIFRRRCAGHANASTKPAAPPSQRRRRWRHLQRHTAAPPSPTTTALCGVHSSPSMHGRQRHHYQQHGVRHCGVSGTSTRRGNGAVPSPTTTRWHWQYRRARRAPRRRQRHHRPTTTPALCGSTLRYGRQRHHHQQLRLCDVRRYEHGRQRHHHQQQQRRCVVQPNEHGRQRRHHQQQHRLCSSPMRARPAAPPSPTTTTAWCSSAILTVSTPTPAPPTSTPARCRSMARSSPPASTPASTMAARCRATASSARPRSTTAARWRRAIPPPFLTVQGSLGLLYGRGLSGAAFGVSHQRRTVVTGTANLARLGRNRPDSPSQRLTAAATYKILDPGIAEPDAFAGASCMAGNTSPAIPCSAMIGQATCS